jgi:8-oxo-dGTP diphosphatase
MKNRPLVGVAEYSSGDLQVKEPDKCEKWEWFVWGKFPETCFCP